MINNFRGVSKFASPFNHIGDYIELVNRFYASWQLTATPVNYYNLDIENSNIEKDKLQNGSYEMIGDLSNYKWRKILLMSVNEVEPLNMIPTADERGVTYSEKFTTMMFPQIYELIPRIHDFLSFDCLNVLNNYNKRSLPMFEVVSIEKSNDFDIGFFKVMCKVSYVTSHNLDKQLSGVYSLVDFEKQIYPIDQSIVINQLLVERTKNKLKNYFDQNSGMYCETLV